MPYIIHIMNTFQAQQGLEMIRTYSIDGLKNMTQHYQQNLRLDFLIVKVI